MKMNSMVIITCIDRAAARQVLARFDSLVAASSDIDVANATSKHAIPITYSTMMATNNGLRMKSAKVQDRQVASNNARMHVLVAYWSSTDLVDAFSLLFRAL